MGSVDKLFKLADRLARKISLAQQSAQAGEIQNVLQEAGLWDQTNQVSALLGTSGVDNGPVAISIQVDNGLNVSFIVSATPPPAATKLGAALKGKYSAAMQKALKTITIKERDKDNKVVSQRPVSVGAIVQIPWLTF